MSTNANGGAGFVRPTLLVVAEGGVVEVQPGSHIDLGQMDAFGFDRSDEQSNRQHR